ncbi:MAG: VanZ family protein [Rhodoferax sp.]|nr:VanZ family protein [Rhodoferax sp.]
MVLRSRTLLGAYLLFVVYGSLVPLDFVPLPLDEAWRRFGQIPFLALGVDSRADWVANGVLYLPLAFLVTRVLQAALRPRPWVAAALALAASWAVALGVEFAQVYFPARTVSLNDLMAEAIGSAIGVLAAPLLAPWVQALGRARAVGGTRFGGHLLLAYVVAYVVLSFFPYDLLLSSGELKDKLDSDAWGWLFAKPDRGWAMALFQLGVEVALAMPLGLWLSRHVRQPLKHVAVGALLGLGIELGQFLIATGVSQGASVLARALGVWLGAAGASRLAALGLAGVRVVLRKCTWPLAVGYLLALAFVNGWFRGSWHGWHGAAPVWAELRWMPFYYHYFTTEGLALYSLGSVALMYLPLVALGWARQWSRWANGALVLLAALTVEIAKLFIDGLRPDPTNLIIAAVAAAVAHEWALTVGQPSAVPSVAGAFAASEVRAQPSWWHLLALAPVAWWAVTSPAGAGLLLGALGVAAGLVWWRPMLALAIIPAGIPALDLAPWTGRFFVDGFDLLVVTCLVVAWHRSRPGPTHKQRTPERSLTFAWVGASLLISALVALWPLPALDANSFSSYYSPFNALRVAKGWVWAALFAGLFSRVGRDAGDRERLVSAGMLIGLAISVAWVMWERAAFVGLFDFAADYRVTGPFSAMHRGGAFIECHLVVGSAFALSWALRADGWRQRSLALVLLAMASYAVMVTYSRNGQAGLVVVAGLTLLAAVAREARAVRPVVMALPVLVVGSLVAVVLLGPFARERLAQTAIDLAVRQAHWADALSMRQHTGWASAFGEGLGSFPAAHFWRSREPVHAAPHGLVREGGNAWLRLGTGATLYIDQSISRPVGAHLLLEADLRSTTPASALEVTLCEKWMLTSATCVSATLVVPRAGPD